MSPALTLRLALWACLGLGASRHTELEVPAGSQVQMAPTSDGFGVGLWTTGMSPIDLRRALSPLDANEVRLLEPSRGESAAWFGFLWPVKHAVLKPAGKKGARHRLILEVELTHPTEALAEHIFDEPLPLPASLEAHTLREADALLQTHHVAEAALLLQRLAHAYPLRAWVLLRLGDIALMEGRPNQACALWQDAIGNGRERTAGRLARLRGFVSGCRVTEKPQWKTLLSREGRDDPVGRQSAEETLWALSFSRDLAVISEILKLDHAHDIHELTADFRQSLQARLLRLSSPLQVAARAQNMDVRAHPEALDLLLLEMSAYCALDIPNAFPHRAQLAQAKSFMKLSPASRLRWRRRAESCQLMVDPTPEGFPAGVESNLPEKEGESPEPPPGTDQAPTVVAASPNTMPAFDPQQVMAHVSDVRRRARAMAAQLGVTFDAGNKKSGAPSQSGTNSPNPNNLGATRP